MSWNFVNMWVYIPWLLQEIADPFYAYCKQHVEKNGLRMKRRNWLALQSNSKQHPAESADKESVSVL